MSKVETERKGSVFIVAINRPDVRNAVDAETAGLLEEAVRIFQRDSALRVMVLTGRGGIAFCAGADLKAAQELETRPGSGMSGPMGFSRITDVQKPSIAAVEGYCLAGGLELACWCDFRIAGEGATFGVVNRRWGVPLIDGGTQRLPRIVGLGNALYLIEAGVIISASQALRMGLVQEIVSDGQALPRALAMASMIAEYPWMSLINDRRAVFEGMDLSLLEGIRREMELHAADLKDREMIEGLDRFAGGQRPPSPRPPQLSG